MKYLTLSLLGACSAALAAKAPVKIEAFTVRPTLAATVLPDATLPLAVDARQWGVFTISEIVPHGSAVKKDCAMQSPPQLLPGSHRKMQRRSL
jgi:preprotein translocase subunit SecB